MRKIPIKVRLTAWYSVVLALGMTALGVLALAGMKHSIRVTVDEQLMERMAAVRKAIGTAEDAAAVRAALRGNLAPESTEELVQVADENEQWVFQSSWLKTRRLLAEGRAQEVERKRHPDFWVVLEGKPFRGMSATVEAGGHRYSVQLAQNIDDFEEAMARFRRMLLMVIPGLLLAAAGAGYWISRRALAPVDAITRAAQEISGRNLSARLEVPDSGDELARLAETLNAMLARIDLALKRIAQFTADASHELRTPVALMRTRAELALRRPRTAQENQETIEQLHGEAVRTSELVEKLMLLARADSGARLMRSEAVELVGLAQEVVAQTSVLAESAELELEAELGAGPVWVAGDARFLRQLLVILIDNAVKYTPAPGKITVGLVVEDGAARISVTDTGIGMEVEELELVFERFYRADKARSRETGGAGLGLSIGRWIAEGHGGTLTAESRLGAGSVFTVRLPVRSQVRS